MTVADDLRTQAGRQATFEQAHHLSKRRASNAKKKTPTSVTWPHDSPTPEQLARAGFYYKPTAINTDNVTCFLCEKSLDGWEPNDNPALEHAHHSPDCGWAINICIGERNGDADREEEDPLSDRMIEARTATFMESWPHESKRGWKCKTKKMVDAGWCFSPTPESDDYATCFYCGLSLDGWEPKDDPMDEHLRRSPDCYFFTLTNGAAATKKTTRGKKGRNSSTSKTTRLSTQSNSTSLSEAPSMLSLGGELTSQSEDSVLASSIISIKGAPAGKGGKKGAKGKGAAKGTGRARKTKKNDEELQHEGADDRIPHPLRLSSINLDSSVLPLGSSRITRATRANARVPKDSSTEPLLLSEDDTTPPKRLRRMKPIKRNAVTHNIAARLSDDASQLQSELQVEASSIAPTRAKRGTKRTSDGLAKSVQEANEAVPTTKQNRGRKVAKQPEAEPAPEQAHQADAEFQTEPMSDGVLAPDDMLSPTEVASPIEGLSSPLDQSTPRLVPVNTMPGTFQSSQSSHQPAQSPLPDIANQPLTGTPPRRQRQDPNQAQPLQPPKEQNEANIPSPAQSSDAENQPPTARPSTTRIPLALAQPTTPGRIGLPTLLLSPSKRTAIPGRIQSTQPWSAIDLETIFLPSPRGKENMHVNEVNGLAMVGNKFELPAEFAVTSPETKMSVEEWIRANAVKAEDRLRAESERVVGLFEREGGRAMRVLEGIGVVG